MSQSNSKLLNGEYRFDGPFQLESGEELSNLKIAYTTYGFLNQEKSNVIWICHALTANSEPHDWWAGLVGPDKLFDPDEHYIVCANLIGSPYGSSFDELQSGITSTITIRDNVNAFIHLKNQLGIDKIHTLIGGSMGGHQALEWSIIEPELVGNLVLCATSAKISPWAIAFNESQRLAIFAGEEGSHVSNEIGLKAARSTALLSYRNAKLYNQTQSDQFSFTENRLAETYQRYQGEKFAKRFNAKSYHLLTKTMDSHDVGRGRNGLPNALSLVQAKTLVIGIHEDLLFDIEESELLARNINGSTLYRLNSKYGHDGFLIETNKITNAIQSFYKGLSIVEKPPAIETTQFGLGCVGQGFYSLLNESNISIDLAPIVVKDENKERSIEHPIDSYSDWKEASSLKENVVELISNDQEALSIAKKALSNGANLVSASKKMIAENLRLLVDLQEKTQSSFLYEAAVAASIPILTLLNSYHQVNSITSIRGVLNGSSNFILSQMTIDKLSYQEALDIAIEKGFAESDPISDVGGFDAKYKTTILALHGFGLLAEPDEIVNFGVQNIGKRDIAYANANGWTLKPVATLNKQVSDFNKESISGYVLPEFINSGDQLSNVHYEENAIQVVDKGESFLYRGKGAGKIPTGMAVLADLKAIARGEQYQYQIKDSLTLDYSTKIKLYLRKNDNKPWLNLEDQKILAESGNLRLVETYIGYLLESQKELQTGYFVAKLPS